jgi:signal transduction histidine kinase
VEDTGVGIPEALRQKVFDRHVRADLGHAGGAGLGLAIVSRVAQHLGWRVALEPAFQPGCRFTLTWQPQPATAPWSGSGVKKV